MITIGMPKLSDSMEEGIVLTWLVADGHEVRRGDEIAEIETDKATMTFEAEGDGRLRHLVSEGDTVSVGAPIAQLSIEAEHNGGRRFKASPLARRMAAVEGLELGSISGSGPHGRVVKADIEAALAALPAPEPEPALAPTSEPEPTAKGPAELVELSRIQQVVARRMAESKATAPDFAVRMSVDMDAAVALREQLRPHADQALPSYNDLVIKASALALRRHPRANGAYRDGHFELFERVNIGMAVAAHDALLVPTVVDADVRSLGTLARETRALAAAARDGSLTAAQLAGGTFTVSNLGMYGVESFVAVLNPPQAAILAVGAVEVVPVVREGAVAVGHRMSLTLTSDHRILYGAEAAEFLATIRDLLQQPTRLLL